LVRLTLPQLVVQLNVFVAVEDRAKDNPVNIAPFIVLEVVDKDLEVRPRGTQGKFQQCASR
jgi:hypothetical protein